MNAGNQPTSPAELRPPQPGAAQESRARRVADLVLIVAFVAAISLPLLDMVFRLDPTPNTEMRSLAPPPKFPRSFGELMAFPTEFKSWIGDHFGFRNLMIRWHGVMKVRGLGISSSDHAVLGKHETDAEGKQHQWLYYAAHGTMEYHLARKPFTQKELEQWKWVLEQRRDWLAARGCRYLFTIAPNAQTIYPEYLPDEYRRLGERDRADQLVAYLREHSTVEIVDMREAVREYRAAHPGERLFHRTDTHWNDVGAFVGYQAVARKLQQWYPRIQPLSLDQFEVTHRQTIGGDVAGVLGIKDHYTEDRIELTPKAPLTLKVARDDYDRSPDITSNAGKGLPRVVMFRDSFGSYLKPYLAEHFEEAVFVWSDQFHPEYVEGVNKPRPDIVITQMVERFFWRTPPADWKAK